MASRVCRREPPRPPRYVNLDRIVKLGKARRQVVPLVSSAYTRTRTRDWVIDRCLTNQSDGLFPVSRLSFRRRACSMGVGSALFGLGSKGEIDKIPPNDSSRTSRTSDSIRQVDH